MSRKRLVICCDGTWLDSTSGLMQGQLPIPSNVTRISQAIKPVSRDGISQVVYYQAGIGSQGGILTRVVGGATAEGLSENIRAAYSFLANNYQPGDEIFFFGFSRGAFTVRSIAGMIDGVGLLTKDGLPFLAEIFKDWENARNPNYRAKNPDKPFLDKPSASDPKYKKSLVKNRLSRLDIPIQVVAVWDTVGSLGIPRVGWLDFLHLRRSTKEYLFYDTKLNDHIINAFQALALDEHRSAFRPAVWEKPSGNQTNLRQVWFPGAHSNVGGGSYPDIGLANITLAWMMSQVEQMLDFDEDYILEQHDLALDHYEETDQKARPWSFGKIYRSFTGIYVLGGRASRTPGGYTAVDPYTTKDTSTPLADTNEYIHPSTRVRKARRGPGVMDMGSYDAHPLDDYKMKAPNADRRNAVWEPRSRRSGLHTLPESPLWGLERELLQEDPRINDYLMGNSRHSQQIQGRGNSISPTHGRS
ncbi:uncharacterized protein KY384_004195 [Bacidia gigantensis]|uniref:uncharacterized protein n=1 Tax=Bacidia gigantensis TaxID=2732470 RepID=UPI001D0521F7|nr:uncharacterized protein KY384_004195 [Bacidia gigantensis]KAG8530838.1 hypothetical protein KY384_004195 [Bacidia gigantensis]